MESSTTSTLSDRLFEAFQQSRSPVAFAAYFEHELVFMMPSPHWLVQDTLFRNRSARFEAALRPAAMDGETRLLLQNSAPRPWEGSVIAANGYNEAH